MNADKEVTLDGSKLKKIAHATHTAIVTATSLALRERLRHSSDITRTRNALARSGERIVESDYMQFWKDLQSAGVGAIVYGRRGKPDRFEWHFSLKSVAKACLEGSDEKAQKLASVPIPQEVDAKKVAKLRKIPPQMASEAKEVIVKSSGNVNTESGQKLVYIPLRKDFDVEIKVPSDFSQDEAEIMARALIRATR